MRAMKLPLLNNHSLAVAAILGLLSLSGHDARGAGEWLAAADDAKLYFTIVDARTGAPLPEVAMRLIGLPAMQTFSPDEIRSLDEKLRLFARQAPFRTDANGNATVAAPFPLTAYFHPGLSSMNRGYLIARAAQAEPFSGPVNPGYFRAEVISGYKGSWGKVHAAYLQLGLVVKVPGEDAAQRVSRLTLLKPEVTPRVARSGNSLEVKIAWDYITIPQGKSAVTLAGTTPKLVSGPEGKGRVHEDWTAKGLKAAKGRGRKSLAVFGYLDAPRKLIRAAASEAVYFVAGSAEEEAAYQRLFEAEAQSTTEHEAAIRSCREIVEKFPDLTAAWHELGRRLLAAQKWQDAVTIWEQAPASGRRVFEFARARHVAHEKLGLEKERWESLLDAAQAADANAAGRELCFKVAAGNKQYDLALKILGLRKGDLEKNAFETEDAYLNWQAGRREVSSEKALLAASGFNNRSEGKGALEALAKVDLKSLPKGRRELYFAVLADANVDAKNAEAAEQAITELSKELKKPREKLGYDLLLARLAELTGDFPAALQAYVRNEADDKKRGLTSGYAPRLYALCVQRMTEKSAGTDGVLWAAGAFSALSAHQFKEAGSLARTALLWAPELPAAHLALGLALEFSGDFSGAVPSLKKAVELAPQDATIQRECEIASILAGETATPP